MSREMKDSGIAWIGNIPIGWNMMRIKNLFTERSELSQNGTETLLSVSEFYGVKPTYLKNQESTFLTRAETLIGYKKCYQGDIVSNIMLAWKGSLGVTDYDGIVSPAYCVYKPLSNIHSSYYHYLFRTNLFTSIFKTYSKGIIDSRLRLYTPYFFDILAIVPPFPEQQRIANYLDRKCTEIDEMISLQEQIIEELKSYKQSVITEAVTKGLNPNVEMKDSGIDWIGKIPKHWGIMRLNELGIYRKGPFGSSLKISLFVPKGVNTIKVYEQQNAIKKDCNLGCAYIPMEYYKKQMINYTVHERDLIVSCAGTIGEIYQIPKSAELGIINQALMRMTMNENILNLKYFIDVFDIILKNESQISSNGSAIKNIPPFNILKKIKVPIPNKHEQQQIVDYLDEKTSQIDKLISVKQQKIEELKDYKKSIIYEYVTGKKEVPSN